MNKRNMASFSVTPQLIEQALEFPNAHAIVGAEWDFASRTVRLFVEGPDLPEVAIGQIVPSIVPIISVQIGDDGKPRHTWKWIPPNAICTPDGVQHKP